MQHRRGAARARCTKGPTDYGEPEGRTLSPPPRRGRSRRRQHGARGARPRTRWPLHARMGDSALGWPRPVEASRELSHPRSEEHTSELQSLAYLVCRLLLEKKKKNKRTRIAETANPCKHVHHT